MKSNTLRFLIVALLAACLLCTASGCASSKPEETSVTAQEHIEKPELIAPRNAAEDLLSSEKYNIDEVAYLSGFRDASYFSRVFYKYFNVRPGKYKRMEKPQEPKALQEDSAEP